MVYSAFAGCGMLDNTAPDGTAARETLASRASAGRSSLASMLNRSSLLRTFTFLCQDHAATCLSASPRVRACLHNLWLLWTIGLLTPGVSTRWMLPGVAASTCLFRLR